MKSVGAAAVGLVIGFGLSAVPASAQPRTPPMRLSANPSAVVAAEIAFSRLAQEKGQWTAFRKTAAKDAVMFVPGMVNALTWLKGRKDPPAAVKWQPEKVLMSCDGSTGVSTGPWQRPDGTHGYFTTIWQRDKKGDWKWVLDHGDTLASPRAPAEFVSTRLAPCPRGIRPMAPPVPADPAALPTPGQGKSADGTLTWRSEVAADHARRIVVSLMVNGAYEDALVNEVAAPQ